MTEDTASTNGSDSPLQLFLIFLRLGLTSFGGPIAHLAYFREEFVSRRKWLDDNAYADLVALCQFLPGPTSSQVGIGMGYLRQGIAGSCLSWLGFTLPSALVMIAFALLYDRIPGINNATWLHGLKVVAVAVVAQALVGMQAQLTPNTRRRLLALAATVFVLLLPGVISQLAVILAGALVGYLLLDRQVAATTHPLLRETGRQAKGWGVLALALFALLLVLLPVADAVTQSYAVELADRFYRAGSLVFGGGHVVLPLLQSETVPAWMEQGEFVAGYGAAQALPGPLFSFAAYVGMHSGLTPPGASALFYAALALLAIFLPGFLLVIGLLPAWHGLRQSDGLRSAFAGVNAVVVGLLLAAFLGTIIPAAVFTLADAGLALAAYALLMYLRIPPWAVVLFCAMVTGLFW